MTQLTADDFAPFVGKVFRAQGHPQELVLVELDTRVPTGWEAMPRKPFSLRLRGPRGPVVPEGMHRLTADDTRVFEVYVVPVQTASRDCQDYQVVFN